MNEKAPDVAFKQWFKKHYVREPNFNITLDQGLWEAYSQGYIDAKYIEIVERPVFTIDLNECYYYEDEGMNT